MIQILSFGSRAQIAQLIDETTNQITNKSKQSSKTFNAAVFLRKDVEHKHRSPENERKKIYFYLTSTD